MISTHRTNAIDQRVAELMKDNDSLGDLFDELQDRGGSRYEATRLALANHFLAPTHEQRIEALDTVCLIMQSLAFERATREYNQRGFQP